MSALATPTIPVAGSDAGLDDVWAWNPSRLEFDRMRATRTAPNTWEIVDAPGGGSSFDPGDLVECELSDGELLVQARVWSSRLL